MIVVVGVVVVREAGAVAATHAVTAVFVVVIVV